MKETVWSSVGITEKGKLCCMCSANLVFKSLSCALKHGCDVRCSCFLIVCFSACVPVTQKMCVPFSDTWQWNNYVTARYIPSIYNFCAQIENSVDSHVIFPVYIFEVFGYVFKIPLGNSLVLVFVNLCIVERICISCYLTTLNENGK